MAKLEAEIPAEFGPYEIIEQLGRGGMGTVYRARERQTGRQVALKVAHTNAEGSETLERFLREARLAATLKHANLCAVYDSGEIGGRYYLTMAYIQGRSLSETLKRSGFPTPRKAAALVRKIANALHAAHAQGIIHRDLKPANIMVDERGEPIVMDFGLARRDQDVRATVSGQMLGTPAYMPPEQVMGDIDAMGPGCDIYSLGVILYELLTGQVPFQGNIGVMMAQIMSKEPERPSQRKSGIDPVIEGICLKAMAKQADARFATMEEFAEALTAYLEGKPTTLLHGALPKPVAPVRKSIPRGFYVSAVALVVAVAAGAAIWALVNRGSIRIESDDPSLSLHIDGTRIELKDGGETMQLRVGKHSLQVKRGDRELETREFTVRKGKNKPIKVQVAKQWDADW